MFATDKVASPPPAGQCISTAEANSYSGALLPMPRMFAITDHVEDCAECAERVRVAVESRAS